MGSGRSQLVTQSQATLSQAMLSQAMLSHAMLSQAMLSQAMLSHVGAAHSSVAHVNALQLRPRYVGSRHTSGWPYRIGYSTRANVSAGRSPLLPVGVLDAFVA